MSGAMVRMIDFNMNEEEQVTAALLVEERSSIYNIQLSFKSIWKHKSFSESEIDVFINEEYKKAAQDRLRGTHVYTRELTCSKKETSDFMDIMEDTVFFSFPDEVVRKVFLMTLQAWITHTSCPAEARLTSSLGYSAVAFHFMMHTLNNNQVEMIGKQIIQAIAHWEIIPYVEPEVVQEVIENDDHFNTVVEEEYDETLEVKLQNIRQNNAVVSGSNIGEVVEELEIPFWKTLTSLKPPFKNKMYAAATSVILHRNSVMAVANTYNSLSNLPREWLNECRDHATRWCWSSEADVLRAITGSYKESPEIDDEVIFARHPNLLSFIQEVDVTEAMILWEQSENKSYLFVFPDKMEDFQ